MVLCAIGILVASCTAVHWSAITSVASPWRATVLGGAFTADLWSRSTTCYLSNFANTFFSTQNTKKGTMEAARPQKRTLKDHLRLAHM